MVQKVSLQLLWKYGQESIVPITASTETYYKSTPCIIALSAKRTGTREDKGKSMIGCIVRTAVNSVSVNSILYKGI